MALTWIKMRVDLQTHPKVVRIMSALRADKFSAIGGLHAVWSVFDAHSEDGRLDGYTLDLMDAVIGWPGFSAAMAGVGWLEQDGQVLVAPDFEDHNGRTAKRRATETQRKSVSRKLSASDADKNRTREEKIREEVNHHQELTTSTNTSPSPVDNSSSSSSLDSGTERAKTLADRLAKLETTRLKKSVLVGATDSRVLGWAVAGVSDPMFREAYDIAVSQRTEGGNGKQLISPGYLDPIIAKLVADEREGRSSLVPKEKPRPVCCHPGCLNEVSGTVSGRPWCRDHRDYAMDNANFRRVAA